MSTSAVLARPMAAVAASCVVGAWLAGAPDAMAQGPARDRTAALESVVRGCVAAGRRDHYPAGAMRAYCRCSARYVFDHASKADIDAGPSRLRRVNGAAARACVNLFPHHHG